MSVELPVKGDPWRFVNEAGAVRRYEVTEVRQAAAGVGVHLACLEPPHAPQKGYRGAGSGEARVLTSWLRERPEPGVAGWIPGHED